MGAMAGQRASGFSVFCEVAEGNHSHAQAGGLRARNRNVPRASPNLGRKLAVLLVQLPPKLSFDRTVARGFFSNLMNCTDAIIACEPRHVTWFSEDASDLLAELGVARVAADPAICDAAARPGDWGALRYWRLHGSPVVYRSSYVDRVGLYASELTRNAGGGCAVWCIFDNTASSAGASDALALTNVLQEARVPYHGLPLRSLPT